MTTEERERTLRETICRLAEEVGLAPVRSRLDRTNYRSAEVTWESMRGNEPIVRAVAYVWPDLGVAFGGRHYWSHETAAAAAAIREALPSPCCCVTEHEGPCRPASVNFTLKPWNEEAAQALADGLGRAAMATVDHHVTRALLNATSLDGSYSAAEAPKAMTREQAAELFELLAAPCPIYDVLREAAGRPPNSARLVSASRGLSIKRTQAHTSYRWGKVTAEVYGDGRVVLTAGEPLDRWQTNDPGEAGAMLRRMLADGEAEWGPSPMRGAFGAWKAAQQPNALPACPACGAAPWIEARLGSGRFITCRADDCLARPCARGDTPDEAFRAWRAVVAAYPGEPETKAEPEPEPKTFRVLCRHSTPVPVEVRAPGVAPIVEAVMRQEMVPLLRGEADRIPEVLTRLKAEVIAEVKNRKPGLPVCTQTGHPVEIRADSATTLRQLTVWAVLVCPTCSEVRS